MRIPVRNTLFKCVHLKKNIREVKFPVDCTRTVMAGKQARVTK